MTRGVKNGPNLYIIIKNNNTMKTIAHLSTLTNEASNNVHVCTCPNQHLLQVGTVCELCMGTVTEFDGTHDTIDAVAGDPFDEMYFEELESFFEDIEYAA